MPRPDAGDEGAVREAWQAQKGVLQRLYESLGPGPFAIGTFVALVLATIGLDRWRDAR